MQLRPPARMLAALGALLLATTLSSCGFGYATDRVYTPANGVNDREADVDVLGAFIVSGQEGSGTFIASFANNLQDKESSVESLAGAGEDASLEAPDFEPVTIPPGGMVNLQDDGGVVVTGDFEAGDFATVSVGFGDGETVEMDVITVAACGIYEGLDTSAESTEDSLPEEATEDQCAEPSAPAEH